MKGQNNVASVGRHQTRRYYKRSNPQGKEPGEVGTFKNARKRNYREDFFQKELIAIE